MDYLKLINSRYPKKLYRSFDNVLDLECTDFIKECIICFPDNLRDILEVVFSNVECEDTMKIDKLFEIVKFCEKRVTNIDYYKGIKKKIQYKDLIDGNCEFCGCRPSKCEYEYCCSDNSELREKEETLSSRYIEMVKFLRYLRNRGDNRNLNTLLKMLIYVKKIKLVKNMIYHDHIKIINRSVARFRE